MLKTIAKYKLELWGGLIGSITGGCYYRFVGCSSGTCPISSNPYISMIYWSFVGVVAFSFFKKETIKTSK